MQKLVLGWVALLAAATAFAGPETAKIVATADHADCRYATGEKAAATFLLSDTNGVPLKAGRVKVTVDNYGARTILPTRTVDLATENPIRVTAGRETPGFVRVRLESADPKALKLQGNLSFGNYTADYTYGIGFDVDKIVPGTPDVADFDAFWADAIRTLDATVPPDVRLEPRTLTNESFAAWRISFATAQGRRVWGWLTEPKDLSKGPYPALVEVAGAGIGFTGPHPGEKDRIVLRMNVHSYPQAEGKGKEVEAERSRLGKAQDERFAKPCGVGVYWEAGIHKSREDYFFYASILGINRAIDWLAARPECDETRIAYAGTSQGGGMGLALAGLNKHISRCVVYVPALTDLLGSRIEERKSGWPTIVEVQKPENREATAKNAPYFCGVNFARRITVPIRFVVGYADHACVPNAIHAAHNACPSKDKAIVSGIAMSHRVYDEFYKRFDAWVRETPGVLFKEDFSNYNKVAPGVTTEGEFDILNDAIGGQKGWLSATVQKDVDLFTSAKPLPSGNAFDVLCTFELSESNSTFDVVFKTADGQTLAVPFSDVKGQKSVILKAAGGEIAEWGTVTNLFVKSRAFKIPGELKTVNFRLKAGGKVRFTDIVVRTPEPLPSHAALEQFPALAALTQDLADGGACRGAGRASLPCDDGGHAGRVTLPGGGGHAGRASLPGDDGHAGRVTLPDDGGRATRPASPHGADDGRAVAPRPPLVSDGKPIDFAGKSYSFVPGTTGVVGSVRITWDSGATSGFELKVGDLRYASPLPGAEMKQLGIKGNKSWCGKDAVIEFTGTQQQLCVRPHLKMFADWHKLCDKGVDVVRDWEKLPPASQHVTTLELRCCGGAGRASLPGGDGCGGAGRASLPGGDGGGAGRASLPGADGGRGATALPCDGHAGRGDDGREARPAPPHGPTECRSAQFWVDGSFARTIGPARDDKKATRIVKAELTLKPGVRYRENTIVPDELELWARPKAKAFAAATVKGDVPGCVKPLDSADAGLSHYAQGGYAMTDDAYTMRSPLDGYPGEVHFRVPAAPYVKAEILFCLDDAPDKVPYLTTRFAHYPMRGGIGHTEIEDSVLDLTKGIPSSVKAVGTVVRDGKDYPLYRTEIDLPLGQCLDFASGDFIDIEFLGPMQENLQQDDRRKKPRHDVSSAFNLFGVKLRKLNVLPEMVQSQPGNVFAEEEKVKEAAVKLTALEDNAKGVLRIGEKEYPYALAKAGDVVTNVYDFSDAEVGLYRVQMTVECGACGGAGRASLPGGDGGHAGRVTLPDGDGRASRPATPQCGLTLHHEIVYCVTPETGRLTTPEESPYGTWWFNTHGSPGDPAIGGPLVKKAGIRKISWNKLKPEEWKKYDCTTAGNVYGFNFNEFDPATGKFKPGKIKKDGKDVEVDGEARFVDHVQKKIASQPFADHLMVWHETAPWCGGIPEEILGLAAPTNDVKREKELAAYINEIGRICHKHFPQLKVQIGNSMHSIGAVAIPLRGGAKAEYYDLIGLEPPCETSMPERMTDVAFLGQNIAKAVGKKLSGRDLKTGGCYEFIYRCERDLGADGEELQARFYMRDILISLMNDYTLIAPGCMFDNRSAYCSTIWGVNAFLRRSPYVYPKKSYLAYAVITKALDGVTYLRELPTGSTTVYAAEFRRKDGLYATAFWCPRGEADLVCDVKGELWTMYGRRSDVGGWFTDAKFTCSPAPVYLISKKPCASVTIAARRFPEDAKLAACATVSSDLSLANVTVAPDPEMESQHHCFLPYLKPGVFTAKDVVDPEEGACLELTLDTDAKACAPITEFVTEYTTVRLKKPIEIPGVAGLFGLRVKGESSGGQVRFEIEDAKGEVFKGLSTGPSWGCDVYDWPGYTALVFDGWSDVYQYTDRNDYGLAISPGPRDEQWVSSTGGNKKIDWPVKLRAVTVCVNRYKPTILGFVEAKNPSVRLKRLWSAPAK